MALVLVSIWRITFINKLIKDWNTYLDEYIFFMEHVKCCSPEYLKFLEKFRLKARNYYLLLNVWEINNIINDPFILQDVLSRIKR